MAETDNRAAKQLEPFQFKAGQSGNPAGRPKGSRNKLAEDFLADVLTEWGNHGPVAISDMREKNPGDFVKMVASLLPKDINLNLNDNLGELSDDELIGQIRELHASLAPLLALADSGDGSQAGAELAARIH